MPRDPILTRHGDEPGVDRVAAFSSGRGLGSSPTHPKQALRRGARAHGVQFQAIVLRVNFRRWQGAPGFAGFLDQLLGAPA
jgi:hypothetical protein